MFELYQDAMSIVRKYGMPELFITFTCNPQWEEITSELLLDQKASDRPHLIVKVYIEDERITSGFKNEERKNGLISSPWAKLHL